MRLLTCHIENFGKLSDFSYDFADGYNAFVLPNGAGKSTFAAFIRVMFYGFAGETKRTELEKERKRYQPWQVGTYGGQLTFTADGKYYLLARVFGKTAKGDSFRLQDANTLLDSTDFTEQIGQELFGIDAESFMRTIYIGQAECAAFAATDSVSAKLGDQMEETEDMASYDVANKKLADAINQMSDKRSTGKLAKLEREAHVLAQELRAKTVVQEALDTVSSQLTAVKARWNACLAGKLPEETEEKEAASPSGQELADTLQQRRNEKNEQRKYKGITGIVLGLLVIIYALLAAGKGYRMLILICGGFSMIAGACMLLGYAIGRKKRQPESKPVQPKPLSEEQQKQRASELEALSRQILQYSRRLDELESEYDALTEKERKLQSLNEEVITLREKCDIIQKTKAFLTQAKENYGARYQKPVMDAFRRYYRMLSGEDGTAYGLTATFEMERQEQGMYRDMGYFSRGYQDMTGLCMRLAFADAMYREKKPFLILDDPFVNLDEEKIEHGRASGDLFHLPRKSCVIKGYSMYTYNKKVLFSDVDATRRMSFGSLMDAMQDCVNINSESVGRGIDYMLTHKRTWFAISWNIEILRIPKMFEEISVKTWAYEFATSIGYRNVIVTDENGEDIVCADSMWTLMDMETKHPVRIEEEDAKGYEIEPRYPMEKCGRKIRLPKEFEVVDTVVVPKADIDYNGHMSNAKYILLANEYVEDITCVNRIRVEYKSQARYKEALVIERAIQEIEAEAGMETHVIIKMSGKEAGDVKAVVDYRLTEA